MITLRDSTVNNLHFCAFFWKFSNMASGGADIHGFSDSDDEGWEENVPIPT